MNKFEKDNYSYYIYTLFLRSYICTHAHIHTYNTQWKKYLKRYGVYTDLLLYALSGQFWHIRNWTSHPPTHTHILTYTHWLFLLFHSFPLSYLVFLYSLLIVHLHKAKLSDIDDHGFPQLPDFCCPVQFILVSLFLSFLFFFL